jgi:transposase
MFGHEVRGVSVPVYPVTERALQSPPFRATLHGMEIHPKLLFEAKHEEAHFTAWPPQGTSPGPRHASARGTGGGYRASIPWRDLPARFGLEAGAHTRHSRWTKSGVWERVFKVLAADADNEYAMIDSTIERAHQHSAGQKKHHGEEAIGLSRGGLSTKIRAMVDALGNPVAFLLTPGQAHDLEGADAFLPQMQADTLLADGAFDAETDRNRSCALARPQ